MPWSFFLKDWSKLLSTFKLFYNETKVQFDHLIRVLCSDNAHEYVQKDLKHFFVLHSVIHQTYYAHTPQQNGFTKCKNLHLLDIARTLTFSMKILKSFWGDAILTTYFLVNHMPSFVMNSCTPHSLMFPTLHFLFLVFFVVHVLFISNIQGKINDVGYKL